MTNTQLSFDELRAAHELGEAIARLLKLMTPPPAPAQPSPPQIARSTVAESPELLSAREAARQLSVCQKTLWSISHPKGALKTVRLGRRVLYPKAALQEWIRNNTSQ